ncbi:EAL domain-containing protein [Aeromicrobium sp.]|uniref:putative bifunctional diguanylate cyclase/phosphodiesterase n=1 Tax=Aeromicrobium sp. TaxID=1871063 RepID=UPI0030BB5C66
MYWRYLAAGAVATAGYFVLPDGLPHTLLYTVVGLSCVMAILLGVRINKPVSATPWYLIAAGQAASATGDILYETADAMSLSPYVSDVAYLAAYPLIGAGITILIRRRRGPGRDLAGLIDSAIVTIGFGLLSWVFVADPILDDTAATVLQRTLAAAYPLADILLLALVIRLVAVPGGRSTAFRLLVGAMIPLFIADTIFATQPTTDYTGVLDLLWLGSYVLFGVTALHPTMAQLSTPSPLRTTPFTARRLSALVGATLIAPLLVIVQEIRGHHVHTWTVVLGASALSLLVVWRMAYNIEEIRTTVRQRDRLESDLFHEASHDSLTGTVNSSYMRQLIGAALRRGQREGTSVGLLVVDLDDFGGVNDRHGHGVGDLALRTVAQRLRAAVRDVDTVGRLAGDQFAILIDSVSSDQDTARLAAQLQWVIGQPIHVSGQLVTIAAGIGASTSMDGGIDPDELLREANVAVRRAKSGGRGRIEMFDSRLRRELGECAALEAALGAGLEAGELEVHFHPVVAVQTDVIDGYEARLRWNRPGHTPQEPATFLPIAEMSDLVCRIDRWVLDQATTELAELTAADPDRHGDLTVAVTISGRTLAAPDLVAYVKTVLARAGLPPHRLTIGVTEMVLVDVPNAVLSLSALRHAGVFISINDFGTGRTPIGQLQHLPADAIKVDKDLVSSDDPGSDDLLTLLVNAAHSCGLLVVADGVERAEQLVELRLLDYDSAPGIYSASPVPADGVGPVPLSTAAGARLRIVPDEA